MKKVIIFYRFLPQYRIEFYNLLRQKLLEYDIELSLIYSKLKNENSSRGDEVSIDWAIYKQNLAIKVGKFELLWQPYLADIKGKDLVIVEQANKLLINYLLMIKRRFSKLKVAYWGHGLDQQANPNSLTNKFKKLIINQADWWFSYTEGVKKIVSGCGFPEEKNTVVQNAIDTSYLQTAYDSITAPEIRAVKKRLGISSENVGIYCGAIYKEKRISFLLQAAQEIRKEIKDFQLIIIGSGPEVELVQKFSSDNVWVHYLGTKFGLERVIYFKISKLFLLPGAVGLAVLDAFSMKTPMITTNYPYHGPEVEYIVDYKNGVVTENTLEAYVNQVIRIMKDNNKLNLLIEGCKNAASKYTIDAMVNNFTEGILSCLKPN